MIKAIVFDFDGLMVDTETSAYDSWQEIYQEHGCTLAVEVWAAVIGGSSSEFDACAHLTELSGVAFDHEELKQRRYQRKLELVANEPLLPGIADALAAARRHDIRLAVASSSRYQWVGGHLDRLGVTHLFETIVCRDDVTRIKPDPELYRTAVQRLGVEPSEAVAIEDSLNGLRAAKAAGLACVVVPNAFTQHLDLSAANLRLTTFADLSLGALLEKLSHGS
jgi:HAD superfamily hydrolase (TIGR01509 family)